MTASTPRQTSGGGGNASAHLLPGTSLLRLVTMCLVAICARPGIADVAQHRPGVRAESGPRPSFRSVEQPEPGDGRHYYGILGQVGQPGSYSSRTARLTVGELVDAAGGLTKEAVPLAKVIRLGRSGLELVNSIDPVDPLQPGDVVMIDRRADVSAPFTAGSPSNNVDVAFVGLFPKQPIVVSLGESSASLPQLVQDLGQHPALIETIQVVRTSATAPQPAPGQRPSVLHEGDIVVFHSEAINVDALLSAAVFPSAIPLDGPTPAIAGDRPVMAIMARSQSTPELVSPGAGTDRTPTQNRQPVASVANESTTQVIATTSMIGGPAAPSGPKLASQRALEDDVQPLDQADFAADSFTRLAMATPSEGEAQQAASFADGTQRASVPAPFDVPSMEKTTARGSRTTTLGITVLVIAVICFAASMLWSRFDETDRQEHENDRDLTETFDPDVAVRSRRTLDQLIENSLPLIEEQAGLPEQVTFHGKSVGRGRIRIDARHVATGPHFATLPESVPEAKATMSTASAEGDKSFRIDPSAAAAAPEASSTDGGRAHAGRPATSSSSERSGGGLLERILVAMEREKRS